MALISVEVDALSASVLDVASSRNLVTRILAWSTLDADQQAALDNWQFDWHTEAAVPTRRSFALLVEGSIVVEGLISVEIQADHLLIHLVESAPHNIGRGKRFAGVAGNLFAFACFLSLNAGCEGYVAFDAKSELMGHYEKTLGARRVGSSSRMIIDDAAADRLTQHYFKATDQWPI